ncbi:type II toxin-antitoxin system Phd/YefM family antitoxin [Sorangium sp. So ce1153]|uniref:type II toxin-antitoxin system Phd/YefM family antitoxin n=1 Tax=Sorangium sp. So ce1153 TaxID=3133333 RepID=UPI003F62F11F
MKPKVEVPAGEFKAHCLKLMEEVATKRTPIVVTKGGRPLVKLVPVDTESPPAIFGCMRGTILHRGDDLFSTGEAWDAERT